MPRDYYNVIKKYCGMIIMSGKSGKLFFHITSKLCEVLPLFFWGFLIFGFEEPGMAIMTVGAALIHEGGHLFCIFCQSGAPSLRSVLSGFRINSGGIKSYGGEIMIYLAGPAANLAVGSIALLLFRLFGEGWVTFGIINLATALSNLLPIRGYDGYGILRALLWRQECPEWTLRMCERFSSCLIFLFCIFSLYLIDRRGGGYWIFAIFFVSMLKSIKDDIGE